VSDARRIERERERDTPRAPGRARPAHAPAAPALPAWAIACFLVSGAAGLIYEIVWSKQLSYLLGSCLLHTIS